MLGASHNPKEERYQSYRYAADKPAEVDTTAAGKASAQTLEYRSPCREPKGKDESDLCAQWKAANAAEDSALWAKWGFWIASIGSALLLWQIILTRRAVEDTSKATAAMERQIEIGEDGQRPWFYPTAKGWLSRTGVKIEPHSDEYTDLTKGFQAGESQRTFEIEYLITLENFGKTPAIIHHAMLVVEGTQYSHQPSQPLQLIKDGGALSLKPVKGLMMLTPSNYSEVLWNPPHVSCSILYEDPLGVVRDLRFAFRMKSLIENEVEPYEDDKRYSDRRVDRAEIARRRAKLVFG